MNEVDEMCDVNKESIKVSILCLTYNHGPYVRSALEGFVNQKTNFKFEVLIHDDASTDSTAEIIKEYEAKYPDIIKPIYQTENQYSKGVKIGKTFQMPRVKGQYVAYCEGDDFWIDENKLQLQVDFLEKNKEYSACAHAYKRINIESGVEKEFHSFQGNCPVTTESVILSDGSLFATCSMVFRREPYLNVPEFRADAPVGDYSLFLQLALEGRIFYIDRVMSCYRFMVPGSWSMRSALNNKKQREEFVRRKQEMLEAADKYSDFKYHNEFESVIQDNWRKYHIANSSPAFLKEHYREYYKKLSIKQKVGLYIKTYLPISLDILNMVRKKCKHGKSKY